jgi:uncharacterized protein (TIGR03435 family)
MRISRKVRALGMLEHGPRLRDRVELLHARRWTSIARVAIGAMVIATGWFMATQRIAFAQAEATFEVAVPGADGAAPGAARYRVSRTPQRIAFEAARVGDIMAFAYGFPLDRIERRPQWMYDDVYNVTVTTAAPAGLPEQKLMLQRLLEERFGLVVHRVSNESPVYYLVSGAKVKLTETKEADAVDIPQFCIGSLGPPLQSGAPGVQFGNVCSARHVSMSDLAAWLYLQVRLPVFDKTGIAGLFDIEIPGLPIRGGAEGTIRAVRNALGLDLESHRGTAESLIVDHVEKPGRN